MASVMRRSLALATDEELETEMVLESYRAEVDGLRECLGLETSGDNKSKSQTRQKRKDEGTEDNQDNEEEKQNKEGAAEEEENEVHHPITLRVDEDDSEGSTFDPMTVATSELDLDEDAEMEVLAGYDHSRRESTIDGKLNDSDSSRIGKRESSIDEGEEVDTETKSDEVESGKEKSDSQKDDGEQNEEINLEQSEDDENKGKEAEDGEEKGTQDDNEELPEVSSLDDEDD
ncbi:hypothetical protein BKA69DRAFT_1096144 [Paraphysoderma sedebokerense]|nr:hypothetical protein BKA69DRAFT_1096144 [Paraphysoderma sedebokerense]